MKLLLLMDASAYSGRAARVAARFAMNTWAEVTILAPVDGRGAGPTETLTKALAETRGLFLGDDSPYGRRGGGAALRSEGEGLWTMEGSGENGRKPLRILVRRGDALRVVSEQVRRDGTDFVILGASAEAAHWDGDPRFPQRVVSSVPCSSLVIKSDTETKTLVCCLDQAAVSQESLEIINQLVTVYGAELKIVGVVGAKGLRGGLEARMMEVLRYYAERDVRAWVRLVDEAELDAFAREASRTGGLGLWLGERSIIRRIFSKDRLDPLIAASRSSVLVLK